VEIVASALVAEGGEIFDFEVPRLLEKMVVGNEVGVFLGRSDARKKSDKGGEHEKLEKRPERGKGHDISLQVICNKNPD
jgi:hypothetical protein